MSGADTAGCSPRSSSGTRTLRGILFDQPHVIEDARQILGAAGVVDRCELVGGSFFDAVPAGGDAYILRGIIPGFEDDQAVAILTNCRRAMAAGARVLLVERYVATDPHEALPVLLPDLEMLVNVGGRERTTDEYATLLARGGFRLARSISLGRPRGDGVSPHRGATRLISAPSEEATMATTLCDISPSSISS